MKIAVRLRAAPSFGWLAAWIFATTASLPLAFASSTDYLFDEGELAPTEYHLSAKAERQADAMAHFITGVFEEESAGPEKALASYRQVLSIDPGFTKLAIEVAYDYLRRGNATEAIGILKDSVKAQPGNPEPALALASIYLRHLRKPDLATRYAEAALKADPGRFSAYEALWEIAQAQGDSNGCKQVIARALKAKTTAANYWLQVADFLANSAEGDSNKNDKPSPQLALCLEKAAKDARGNADSLARIGDLYIICRDTGKASTYYRQAADLKPELPGIQARLASTLVELGLKEEAIPALEKLIAENPLDVQAYDQLYRLYQDLGKYGKALTTVDQALIIAPKSLPRQRDLLLLLLRAGHVNDAITRSAEARRLFPNVPFFTYIQARSLAAARRDNEAMVAFEQTLNEATASDTQLIDSVFFFEYASTAQLTGRIIKAAEMFKKSIALDPKNADAYNALGYMWAERGENLADAERLIRQALALEPASGAYLDSLGWLHYRRGNYQAAIDELLRAAKAMPQPDAVVFEHIGDTYRALNHSAEALLYWQKAARLDSTNKPLIVKIDEAAAKMAAQSP